MTTFAPAFTIQRSEARARFDHGWLRTAHSFSFAEYRDPANQGWGALRVFNDDVVAGGAGFPPHPHRDMEIVTYVLSGELRHEDSLGNRGVVGAGGVQYMSAGTGVRHGELNNRRDEPLHFIQMWVLPKAYGAVPSYGQANFEPAERHNRWLTIASGAPGIEASIRIGQDASFAVARIEGGALVHTFAAGRYGFLFVADGTIQANGEALQTGDAIRLFNVPNLALAGRAEVLLWDLPG